MNMNELMQKKHDLQQYRADALEQATKAFAPGGDKAQYDAQMSKVEGYNKELEQLDKLMKECGKTFPDGTDLGERAKGAVARAEQTGVKLLGKICDTEEYSAAWLESIAKGVSPDKGINMESLSPLYEAEKAMKALTIGGGDPAGSDGGFLVPEEFNRQIITLAKEYVDLSTLVTVEHVNSQTGWRAVETSGATALAQVSEMGKITASAQPKFEKVAYNCKKYAGKLPISNELLDGYDRSSRSGS